MDAAYVERVRLEELVKENSRSDAEIPEPNWNSMALQRDFEVLGFLAPYVAVRRRSDGQVGTLAFRHHPRVYHSFVPDDS